MVVGNQELFVVSTNDKVIGRELFLHGSFDFYKLESAIQILAREGQPSPNHLIDVGANIGSIVIPAICRGIVQSATAIEPHPDNVRLLRTNLAFNGITDRVSLHQLAAGNESNSTLKLCESTTNSGNHTIGDMGINIQATRLDDLDLPVERSLLWMDIEGYEGHALDGAKRLLSTGIPVVSEFNPEYLRKSGGLSTFLEILEPRKIFDLEAPDEQPTSLEKLLLTNKNTFTDILAI
jgi:FkbM family methyltransferase